MKQEGRSRVLPFKVQNLLGNTFIGTNESIKKVWSFCDILIDSNKNMAPLCMVGGGG